MRSGEIQLPLNFRQADERTRPDEKLKSAASVGTALSSFYIRNA